MCNDGAEPWGPGALGSGAWGETLAQFDLTGSTAKVYACCLLVVQASPTAVCSSLRRSPRHGCVATLFVDYGVPEQKEPNRSHRCRWTNSDTKGGDKADRRMASQEKRLAK